MKHYFWHKGYTDKIKEELHQAIDESNTNLIYDILSKLHPIYIGKSEYGWKFTFSPHDFQYFQPRPNSFIGWLKSADFITDDNNVKMSVDEFIDKIKPEIYDSTLYDMSKFAAEHVKDTGEDIYKPMFNDLARNYSLQFNVAVNPYNEFYIGEFLFDINVSPDSDGF